MGYIDKQISDKGGNLIALVELDGDNKIPETLEDGVNCIILGHINESETDLKASKEIFKSEDGKPRATEYSYEGGSKATLMQRGKDILDFLCFSVRDKKFLEIKYLGIVDGKLHEKFSVVEVTPQMLIKTPGAAKSNPYESTIIVQRSAVEISSDDIDAINEELGEDTIKCTSFSIPADQEHVLVETSLAEPNPEP
ncbi:MAG: hypothetical protein FJ216_07420 [Ignavibacteria bacterium]|nr:hypothetical protein [Ignavibacteria bacterium]